MLADKPRGSDGLTSKSMVSRRRRKNSGNQVSSERNELTEKAGGSNNSKLILVREKGSGGRLLGRRCKGSGSSDEGRCKDELHVVGTGFDEFLKRCEL